MLNKHLFLAISLSTFILSGCSTTHNIEIRPEVKVSSSSLTNDRVIQVSTSTLLDSKVGSIETGIKETATIFATNNISQSVNDSVVKGLMALGFTPDQGVMPPASLNIEITKMNYATEVEKLKTIATIDFEIKATLTAKGQTYKSSYGSQKVREYGTLPFEKDVESDMNDLASQTVNRLLKDPNIITLLQSN